MVMSNWRPRWIKNYAIGQLSWSDWLNNLHKTIFWFIIMVVGGLILAIYLSNISHIAMTKRKAELANLRITELEHENSILLRRILAAQSLDRVDGRANELNLEWTTKQVSKQLTVIVPALPLELIEERNAQPPPAESIQELLGKLLSKHINSLLGITIREEVDDV